MLVPTLFEQERVQSEDNIIAIYRKRVLFILLGIPRYTFSLKNKVLYPPVQLKIGKYALIPGKILVTLISSGMVILLSQIETLHIYILHQ